MPQVTHFNDDTLVRYLRGALKHLQNRGIAVFASAGGVQVNVNDALRDLNEQFPELSEKEEKFLHIIRATHPKLLAKALALVKMPADEEVPANLTEVNNLYFFYLSTCTHLGK